MKTFTLMGKTYQEEPVLTIRREGSPVVYTVSGADADRLWKALNVIARTPAIRGWLAENDPKALEQVVDALKSVTQKSASK